MIIKWLGYSSFRIDTRGKTIAINPYSGDPSNFCFPRFQADIILFSRPKEELLVNNEHPINPFVLAGPGEIEKGGVFIEGIIAHYNPNDEPSLNNVIYLIESEDMVVAHLGYLKQKKLKDNTLEKISRADILLLPVGGHGALGAEEAIFVSNQIEPKIIIPMNYALPSDKIKLDKLDKFTQVFGKKPEILSKLSIRKSKLPTETKLIVLEK